LKILVGFILKIFKYQCNNIQHGLVNNFQKFFEEEEKENKKLFEQKLDLDICKTGKETQE